MLDFALVNNQESFKTYINAVNVKVVTCIVLSSPVFMFTDRVRALFIIFPSNR